MNETKILYRVVIKTTGSMQPGSTYWNKEVAYCGYDRLEACRVFHANRPLDREGSYGNPARRTVGQRKEVHQYDESTRWTIAELA